MSPLANHFTRIKALLQALYNIKDTGMSIDRIFVSLILTFNMFFYFNFCKITSPNDKLKGLFCSQKTVLSASIKDFRYIIN